MEKPSVEFLTDEQWLTLMKIVSDEMTVRIWWPRVEYDTCIVNKRGIEYVIEPDGEYVER